MAVITYKCPNCGGDLQFDPGNQKFHCQYCSSDFEESSLEAHEAELRAATEIPQQSQSDQQEKAAADEEAAAFYTCPSCGAEIVTDATTAATFCYYCHNPVIMSEQLRGDFNPDYVLPFAINREKALEIFGEWIGKKKYVPKAFYDQDQIEKLTGVYFPYWLYNCQVDGKLDAQGVKLKSWKSGNIQYVRTEQFDVVREGRMDIKHVTRNALKKANRQLVEGVLPFDMKKLVPFHMSYLSGFQAEKRDMEKQDFSTEVENEVQQFAAQTLRSQVSGYNSVNVRSQNTDIAEAEWKYALMPVWTLTYQERGTGKLYYYTCNGQSGKICGELPIDKQRLAKLFVSIAAPLFVVLMIVGYML